MQVLLSFYNLFWAVNGMNNILIPIFPNYRSTKQKKITLNDMYLDDLQVSEGLSSRDFPHQYCGPSCHHG